MNNPSVPTTITIDGTTYRVGADLKILPVRGGLSMTRRRALTGPNGGGGELIEFSDGSWRLLDSRGATRSKGPRPGEVDRPRARTSETNRVTPALLAEWLAGAQEIATRRHNEHFPTLEHPVLSISPRGRRYAKIVEGKEQRGRRVWAFIDLSNGDVLRPHGWDAPAEGARGNLFDRWQGLRFLDWTGPFYLEQVTAILHSESEAPRPSAAQINYQDPATPATDPTLSGELIAAPRRETTTLHYLVFQTIGGPSDGQFLSFRSDADGELLSADDRAEIERAVRAGSLRQIGTRSEEQTRIEDGRWLCVCNATWSFTQTSGQVSCASCGHRQEIGTLAPSRFLTCAYCKGDLPAGADRHWHAECADGARAAKGLDAERTKGPATRPAYWNWGRPKSR